MAAIGVAQEFQRVFTCTTGTVRVPGGAPHFGWAQADRRVTAYYFYLWDTDFGPAFIKIVAYFLYPVKICLLTELRAARPVGTVTFLSRDRRRTAGLGRLGGRHAGWAASNGGSVRAVRLLDPAGAPVGSVAAFLSDLQAGGRPATTQRSYGLALLRWFRFLWAIDVSWDAATRVEARDFCRWVQVAGKPIRPHWRETSSGATTLVTGKASPGGRRYAAATRAHGETVLRGFYEFHLQTGSGPMVNPFPLSRGRRSRANEHHNPMEPFRRERAGLFRPRVVARVPRQIPEEKFNEVFAHLGSDRDGALVVFWVSTGARASELLGATRSDTDPGQQLITVIRKGSRALQQLPASPDAFVWLRLYQARLEGLVPAGSDQPLWWTLRRPFRVLSYHAAYRMFTRVTAALWANWTPHDLRHTAAYRMVARDDHAAIPGRSATSSCEPLTWLVRVSHTGWPGAALRDPDRFRLGADARSHPCVHLAASD